MTSARMRRMASDYEQIKKEFDGHKYITVTPVGEEPYEKYIVTYFVNGIYLSPDGKVQNLGRHQVEIILHSEYPRYKPICRIMTPIWHPNFRDGQICIGDIWGAGESLSDIIINIGDMIQYKSWNATSPLSADAARWAIENKYLFPVGNINLYSPDAELDSQNVDIDVFDEENSQSTKGEDGTDIRFDAVKTEAQKTKQNSLAADAPVLFDKTEDGNDFDITPEELEGIEFVPTAQRMQIVAPGGVAKSGRLNFKTVLVKGLLWAILGAFVGFLISDLTAGIYSEANILRVMGHEYMAQRAELEEEYDKKTEKIVQIFEKNGIDVDSDDAFADWYYNEASPSEVREVDTLFAEITTLEEDMLDATMKEMASIEYRRRGITNGKYDEASLEKLFNSMSEYEIDNLISKAVDAANTALNLHSAIWSAIIAMFIGLFLGIGEGVFYGSGSKAVKYGLIGMAISLALGFLSGYLAQLMYSTVLGDDPSDIAAAFIRGFGWAIMGIGIGLGAGLIKFDWKRILFCLAGGTAGAFMGGFLFNFIVDIIPDDVVARGVGIVLMGILIGIGVGLLEQFAKQAWLRVVRGEFEGKEYLVFAGTTSIGNSGKNSIVLFKDKLVGPHHCDIVQEGNKYVLVDCGTPMGTVVNGMRTSRHMLRHGDAIAIGNSVLVFNTK